MEIRFISQAAGDHTVKMLGPAAEHAATPLKTATSLCCVRRRVAMSRQVRVGSQAWAQLPPVPAWGEPCFGWLSK